MHALGWRSRAFTGVFFHIGWREVETGTTSPYGIYASLWTRKTDVQGKLELLA